MSRIRPLSKVFISNRGEIARRIALSAKARGYQTVTLIDQNTPHPGYLCGLVDQFLRVPELKTSHYLDQETLIRWARETGCDAIHPGFGFLSESADFARAVEEAGLTWVGPRPDTIEAMASKALARQAAKKAGVPTVPGLQDFQGSGKSQEQRQVQAFASEVGLPILIKAALGGGGKGMRIVNDLKDLPGALERAQSEAFASFGDGTLIVEKYLTTPRHVEVQVFGDHSGHIEIYGDRDCSVQRRHQKIIEEAPAPNLPTKTREKLHDTARSLAQAVGYVSAGTVEYLVDYSNPDLEELPFYFLEMNTRLQVEHPVTEEVYGIDLVDLQFRIAEGESIPEEMKGRKPHGHCIEARIYAEDTNRDFFPDPGPVHAFFPWYGPGVRWEVGLDPIDQISSSFDPMVAKAVAHAQDRPTALNMLAMTLQRTIWIGPNHNMDFISAVLRDPEMSAGPVATSFLSTFKNPAKLDEKLSQFLQQLPENWSVTAAVESEQSPAARTQRVFSYPANARKESWQLTDYRVIGTTAHDGRFEVATGHLENHGWARIAQTTTMAGVQRTIVTDRGRGTFRREVSSAQVSDSLTSETEILAPVPGKIIAVKVSPQARVEAGDTIFILESMKMEFEVNAPKDGIIASVGVAVGSQVDAGAPLAVWD